MGSHLHKLSLGLKAPAHVLKNKDVSRLVEQFARPQGARRRREVIDAVGVFALARIGDAHAVGRADHQERIRFRLGLGHVDGGEELRPVTHRHAVLVLGVVLPHVEGRLVGFLAGRRRGRRGVLGLCAQRARAEDHQTNRR